MQNWSQGLLFWLLHDPDDPMQPPNEGTLALRDLKDNPMGALRDPKDNPMGDPKIPDPRGPLLPLPYYPPSGLWIEDLKPVKTSILEPISYLPSKYGKDRFQIRKFVLQLWKLISVIFNEIVYHNNNTKGFLSLFNDFIDMSTELMSPFFCQKNMIFFLQKHVFSTKIGLISSVLMSIKN